MTAPAQPPRRPSMPLPRPFQHLSPAEVDDLSQVLETVRFEAGALIFHEGDAGDCCYFLDGGTVRLEIPRPEVDSEGVLAYLEPGSVLGEVALLDEQPRSASAYAEAAVVARQLTVARLEQLTRDQPALAATFLRALGADAARKLRKTTERLSDFIFADEPDPEVDAMVAQAQSAQRAFATWDEPRVDALLRDLADAVASRSAALAAATVEETKIGDVASKVAKNVMASVGVYQSFAGRPGTGVVANHPELNLDDVAQAAGVVFGLIPQTNPVATAIFKALIALKARNALILSFHHTCRHVGNTTAELMVGVLQSHGAPEGLLQWVKNRTSRKKTQRFMSHPGVALVLATGGQGMVKAAYSSGTPAIGVGSGNAPCLVTADADLGQAAAMIVQSKSFDNGLICGSEHNLVVEEAAVAPFTAALAAMGAAVLTPEEAAKAIATIVEPRTHALRPQVIGQSAQKIVDFLGITRPYPVQLVVIPTEPDMASPMTGEKLTPILSLFTVPDTAAGLDLSLRLLARQGAGHTAVIHSGNAETIARFGAVMPASRILVNAPAAQGVAGLATGLMPSFTLGCGYFGGNSTTDNVTYTHLYNIKRVARFDAARATAGAAMLAARAGAARRTS